MNVSRHQNNKYRHKNRPTPHGSRGSAGGGVGPEGGAIKEIGNEISLFEALKDENTVEEAKRIGKLLAGEAQKNKLFTMTAQELVQLLGVKQTQILRPGIIEIRLPNSKRVIITPRELVGFYQQYVALYSPEKTSKATPTTPKSSTEPKVRLIKKDPTTR